MPEGIIFATYAESDEALHHVLRLVQSLRAFGGSMAQRPVRAYVPAGCAPAPGLVRALSDESVVLRDCRVPGEAAWLYYAAKPFAAAAAEKDAAGKYDLLAWLDDDTIVLDEPCAFRLSPEVGLAYAPVMHNRSGSLFDLPPDPFWARIYAVLQVSEDMLFPMTTPADGQRIRAYFQAGLMVTRPSRRVMQRWAIDFERLYGDSELTDMCRADRTRRVFLHQAALVGAVLHTMRREEMVELPGNYNYPLFFERGYAAKRNFDSLEQVATMRLVVSREQMGSDWHRSVTGPADRIEWLRSHLP